MWNFALFAYKVLRICAKMIIFAVDLISRSTGLLNENNQPNIIHLTI